MVIDGSGVEWSGVGYEGILKRVRRSWVGGRGGGCRGFCIRVKWMDGLLGMFFSSYWLGSTDYRADGEGWVSLI